MMETKEVRKRIEFRANLTVVRPTDLVPVKPVVDGKNQRPEGKPRNTAVGFMPVDSKGYIKCKNHDFF